MSDSKLSTMFLLNASIQVCIEKWSKNVYNGHNHKSNLSSLFLKFKSMANDCNCKKEIDDDGKNYEINIVQHNTEEEMYASLNGFNEIGHPESYYVMLFQYLKGYVTIEASICFDNDKVSYINYSYDSPKSRESFSYKNGVYIGA